jgi:hypothetical protein
VYVTSRPESGGYMGIRRGFFPMNEMYDIAMKNASFGVFFFIKKQIKSPQQKCYGLFIRYVVQTY